MDDEYKSLLRNQTWELVAPSSRHPIRCKWVFRIKRRPDGSVDKYKARLDAKGFLQEYGKDYFDTFSPVTKPVTIRTVLSIALSRGWSLRQLDVNNVFLPGRLQEEVYMVQPPGYVHPQFPNYVCKLRRSLYGLKQVPRAWYMALTSFLVDFGFTKSQADASLFIYNHNGIICYFLVYVDDILLTSNNNGFMNDFIHNLSSRFSIKDLGYPSHFLGVEFIPTAHGLFLSQYRHIHDLLTLHRMDGAKSVQTPLCSSQVLTLEDGTPKVDPTPYRKLVGSLQYLAFIRPDISFAVNKLSQFMHQPTQTHWQALKRLLRYLKGTVYHGMFLKKKSPLELTTFSDSDWGGVSTVGRSTTAYILYLGSNIISWNSARQKSVSRSSTEAEYKALANAAAELAWVENLLKELGLPINVSPRLYCDNTGATYLCANPVYHSRMKHVALDYHFVREKVAAGTLRIHHINSADQLADALTKPLSRAPFLKFGPRLVFPMEPPSCGGVLIILQQQLLPVSLVKYVEYLD
ncbi:putative RNA-directed DNA polymerase [Helianthus debilis subsp. tardiflorus]